MKTSNAVGLAAIGALAVGGAYLILRDSNPRPRKTKFARRFLEESRNPPTWQPGAGTDFSGGGMTHADRLQARVYAGRMLHALEASEPEDAAEIRSKILGTDDGRWLLGLLTAVPMTTKVEFGGIRGEQIRSYVHEHAAQWYDPGNAPTTPPPTAPTVPPSPMVPGWQRAWQMGVPVG